MRELALFAGIGGFPVGLERSGLSHLVSAVEIDPFCQKVLAKHWPDVPCHSDIKTREFKEGEADIITAGFPCQDISLAGAGAGLAGSRSGLWREVVRAIRVVRPKIAILENVAALLGRGLGRVLGDLAEIGHDAEWHCLPAGRLGAPHWRDRFFAVAYPNGSRLQGCWGNAQCPDKWSSWAGFSAQDWSEPNPDIYREPNGLPNRSHRLKALGNALVSQIPEIIGRAIASPVATGDRRGHLSDSSPNPLQKHDNGAHEARGGDL